MSRADFFGTPCTSATREWIIEAAKSKNNLETIKRENLIMPKLATQISLSTITIMIIIFALLFRYRTEIIAFLRLNSTSERPAVSAPVEQIEMNKKPTISEHDMYPVFSG